MSTKHTPFGNKKDEIWQQLCENPKFSFKKGETEQTDRIIAKADNWKVVLDTHNIRTKYDTHDFTRIRAPYVNKDGFRFSIYRGSIFDEIAKLFGKQDIKLGYEELDRQFIIQANDEEKMKELFADPVLADELLLKETVFFEVREDEGFHHEEFPEGVDELYLLADGIITNPDVLRSLYDLFSRTLQRLCHLGSAYENDPSIEI